jgi:hypothetical protein
LTVPGLLQRVREGTEDVVRAAEDRSGKQGYWIPVRRREFLEHVFAAINPLARRLVTGNCRQLLHDSAG